MTFLATTALAREADRVGQEKTHRKGLDFVFEKRILKLSSGWLVWLERLSDNATGGNMVESPPQFAEMTE